jgi:hypothetical protein
MSIESILSDSSTKWSRNAPAPPEAIHDLISRCAIDLPGEYLEFLQFSNGGESELGVEPGWFRLWPEEQVVELNEGYDVAANLPGLLGFGSNGAGEMFAFDTRSKMPWPIVMIPFIPMELESLKTITLDFESFVKQIGREFAG